MAVNQQLGRWIAGENSISLSEIAADNYDETDVAINSNWSPYVTSLQSRVIGGTRYQVGIWWGQTNAYLVARIWGVEDWTVNDLTGILTPKTDNHDGVVCGLDKTGIVHIAYDHHTDPLNYRKSVGSIVTSRTLTIGSEISMLGTNESEISYPMFCDLPDDELGFTFRDGASGNGDTYFYELDTGTGNWGSLSGLTAGFLANGKGSTGVQSWYHNIPHLSADRKVWFSGSWRFNPEVNTYYDPFAFYYDFDLGTFHKPDGTSQTVPITASNTGGAAKIYDHAGTTNPLFTWGLGTALTTDADNNPIVVYPDDRGDGVIRAGWFQRWNGSAWTTRAQTPIQNPQHLLFDRDAERAYIIYRDADVGLRFSYADAPFTSFTEPEYIMRWPLPSQNWTIDINLWHDTSVLEGLLNPLTTIPDDQTPDPQDSSSGYDVVKSTERPYVPAGEPELINYSVMVHATPTADWWAAYNAHGDPGKIRVRDFSGATEFPRDVLSVSSSLVWMRVYWSGTRRGTPAFFIEPDGAASYSDSDTYGADSAYDANWRAYIPFGGGTDRTSNALAGTAQGGVTVGAATGRVGFGTDFEFDSVQYIDYGDVLNFDYDEELHLFVTTKPESFPASMALINNQSAAGKGLALRTDGTSPWRLLWFNLRNTLTSNDLRVQSAGTVFTAGQFITLDVSHDGTGTAAGVDGRGDLADLGLFQVVGPVTASILTNDPMGIGARASGPALPYDGIIQEVQFHAVVRPEVWRTYEVLNITTPDFWTNEGWASSFLPAWASRSTQCAGVLQHA